MKSVANKVLENKMTIRQASESSFVPKNILGDIVKEVREGKAVDVTPQMGRFNRTSTDELEEHLCGR